MKKIVALLIVVCLVLSLCGCGKKTEIIGTITVFNYGDYIDRDMLDLFTEETGIAVKYEEALTPEEMYTKYKAGAINYDLVCSTDYMIQKLIAEGELQEIDMSKLENKDNIGERYWNFAKAFDPENKYTVPYFWGTLGILYDKTRVKKPIDSWNVLFDGDYSGEIIMQNSMRDMFMLALKKLGYSLNSNDENEIRQAYQLLLEQKSDVQAYLVDEARDEVVAGNAIMAVVYSGEAYLGKTYNENLEYVVPKEGSNVWLDSWGITKKCENVDAAHKFLDFLCREDVAKRNFEYIYFSTPNEAVINSLSAEERSDETIVPSEKATENCEVCVQTKPEITELMNDLWKKLKSE